MFTEKAESCKRTLSALQSKPTRTFLDSESRFLPHCPDMFCCDLDFVESILVKDPGHYIHIIPPEMRPFYVFGILQVLDNQQQVDSYKL